MKNILSPKKFRNQDEKFKRKFGKWLNYATVFFMLAIFLLCAGFGHLFDLLITKFDNRSIFNVEFAFKKNESLSSTTPRSTRDLTISQEIPNPPIPIPKNTTTAKPNIIKIKHTFAVVGANRDKLFEEAQDEENIITSKFNRVDVTFLEENVIDLHKTVWGNTSMMSFVIFFPFCCEIVAIIWGVMLLTYQSGSKRHWTLPNPWRIVVPSIVVYFIMSVFSITFTFIYTRKVANLCSELKKGLQEPDFVSCGTAIKQFQLTELPSYKSISDDTILELLGTCNIGQTILWICCFFIMLLRFIFAVDFQAIEINIMANREMEEGIIDKSKTFCVSKQKPSTSESTINISRSELNKSRDEDYHSAKSQHTTDSLEMSSMQPLLQNDEDSKNTKN